MLVSLSFSFVRCKTTCTAFLTLALVCGTGSARVFVHIPSSPIAFVLSLFLFPTSSLQDLYVAIHYQALCLSMKRIHASLDSG